MNNLFLEACVGSVDCGLCASDIGVDRLEFCANLEIGGTTPSPSAFSILKTQCHCPINVLIRPRAGDFLYSDFEFQTILDEIRDFKARGADGFVFGFLTKEGMLDLARMEKAMAIAGGAHVTLHRAFDMCKDAMQTIDLCTQLGVNTILTSGQKPDALQGQAMLKTLQAYAANRVTIMVCGSIQAEKIEPIHRTTAITTFHMAGLSLCESAMEYRNPSLSMGSTAFDEFTLRKASPILFQKAVAVRDALNATNCREQP